MERKTLVETLRYDVSHKWKKQKDKVRTVLQENEFEELGGKLTSEEVKHIFGETVLYKPTRLEKKIRIEHLLVCETCGRYTRLRWYFEDLPDVNEIWKAMSVGNETFSPKIEILECFAEKHSVVIKPIEELENIKCLKYDIKHETEIKEENELMSKIFG